MNSNGAVKTVAALGLSGLVSGSILVGAGLFTGREVPAPAEPTPQIVYVTVTPTPWYEPERLIATPILHTPEPAALSTTAPPTSTATPTPALPTLPPLPTLPVLTPVPTPTPCVPGRSQGTPPAHGFCDAVR